MSDTTKQTTLLPLIKLRGKPIKMLPVVKLRPEKDKPDDGLPKS
jgi:hypothetical protein